MAYVVTGSCQGCRFTHCVAECPADCFHLGVTMLYIDPVDCIDCGACAPACPVDAIFRDRDLPPTDAHWVELNAVEAVRLPVLRSRLAPLPGAEGRGQGLG